MQWFDRRWLFGQTCSKFKPKGASCSQQICALGWWHTPYGCTWSSCSPLSFGPLSRRLLFPSAFSFTSTTSFDLISLDYNLLCLDARVIYAYAHPRSIGLVGGYVHFFHIVLMSLLGTYARVTFELHEWFDISYCVPSVVGIWMSMMLMLRNYGTWLTVMFMCMIKVIYIYQNKCSYSS